MASVAGVGPATIVGFGTANYRGRGVPAMTQGYVFAELSLRATKGVPQVVLAAIWGGDHPNFEASCRHGSL